MAYQFSVSNEGGELGGLTGEVQRMLETQGWGVIPIIRNERNTGTEK